MAECFLLFKFNVHLFIFIDNEFYECTLCTAKSGRKDNIRRHVRNLHADSEDELQLILRKIFDNFAKKKHESSAPKENKTEKSDTTLNVVEIEMACAEQTNETNRSLEPMECMEETTNSSEIVRNIATSVIKFVGRAPDVQLAQNKSPSRSSREHKITSPAINDKAEPNPAKPKSQHSIEKDSIPEIGVNLPSFEPLSFDQFPDIAPLPLLNTNTNLNVYRQLLSPYLKKQSEPTPKVDSNIRPIEPQKSPKVRPTATVVIDRPPKKRIEKYDIYRN